MPAPKIQTVVADSIGATIFDPASLPHTYAYNGDGTLATDTCQSGTKTWVKTYSYTAGILTGESAWVKQ